MDLSNPLLIHTAQKHPTPGQTPFTPKVLVAVEPFYRRKAIYGRPSEQGATGIFREKEVRVTAFHISPPDRAEFQHRQVVWRGVLDAKVRSRAPYGNDVYTQRHRSFSGLSAPYYQALAAPSITDVAKFMGGLQNAYS